MTVTITLPSGQTLVLGSHSVSIGSDRQCQVWLPEIRPRHAKIIKVAGKCMVESEGDWLIRVNDGVPGRKLWLNPGDTIHLAESGPVIVFEPRAEAAPSATAAEEPPPLPPSGSRTLPVARRPSGFVAYLVQHFTTTRWPAVFGVGFGILMAPVISLLKPALGIGGIVGILATVAGAGVVCASIYLSARLMAYWASADAISESSHDCAAALAYFCLMTAATLLPLLIAECLTPPCGLLATIVPPFREDQAKWFGKPGHASSLDGRKNIANLGTSSASHDPEARNSTQPKRAVREGELSEDYFPLLAGETHLYFFTTFLPNGFKYHKLFREDHTQAGEIRTTCVKQLAATADGKSFDAPWPVSSPATARLRINDGFVELESTAVAGEWEPIIKIGARPGETWEWKKTGQKYTYSGHELFNGEEAVVIESVMSFQGNEFLKTKRFYRKGVGLACEINKTDGKTVSTKVLTSDPNCLDNPSVTANTPMDDQEVESSLFLSLSADEGKSLLSELDLTWTPSNNDSISTWTGTRQVGDQLAMATLKSHNGRLIQCQMAIHGFRPGELTRTFARVLASAAPRMSRWSGGAKWVVEAMTEVVQEGGGSRKSVHKGVTHNRRWVKAQVSDFLKSQ